MNTHIFEQKMKTLFGDKKLPERIGVAVSGGADSLCLTLMTAAWAKKNKVELFAFTVDHGLRAESAAEAAWVHDILPARDIHHETLVWGGRKPATRIEEKAREARYALLTEACQRQKIKHLLLAHHRDDQAETFWLRLARSSGVDGLSAMQPMTQQNGIYLLRPFLDFSRMEIQSFLKEKTDLTWVEDPSNQSLVYERVRLRQAQKELDTYGLTSEVVALSAKRLARARTALESLTETFLAEHVQFNRAGFSFVKWGDFSSVPDEIKIRVLGRLFAYAGGVPRLAQLEKLLLDMPCRMTLAACQVVPVKNGFFVCAELSKMPAPLFIRANQKTRWGRFDVLCNRDVTVAPLQGALQIKGLPALVRRTIPAFFDKKGLAYLPALDYKRERTDINGSIEIKE